MNIKDKLVAYTKIVLVLVAGFILSGVLNREVFISDSPKIRPHLPEYLASRIGDGWRSGGDMIADLNIPGIPNRKVEVAKKVEAILNGSIKDIPLKAIAPGVYAKENDEVSYTLVKVNEVQWIQYHYKIRGKDVTIEVPLGETPPNQQRIEQLTE